MRILLTLFIALAAGMCGMLACLMADCYPGTSPYLVHFLFWVVAALIVMGLYGLSRFIELVFGREVEP